MILCGTAVAGPPSTMIDDEFDSDLLDVQDTELVWLEPGQTFSTGYTFAVTPKMSGIRPSDVHSLTAGNTYEITLQKRRWRWMFDDELPADLDNEAKRESF